MGRHRFRQPSPPPGTGSSGTTLRRRSDHPRQLPHCRFHSRDEENTMTTKFIAADGTPLDDELIKELTAEAEQGFPNSDLTNEPAPWSRREPMETHSLRVPTQLWELLEQQAQQHDMSVSEYTR